MAQVAGVLCEQQQFLIAAGYRQFRSWIQRHDMSFLKEAGIKRQKQDV
jgi:hypothetical protein